MKDMTIVVLSGLILVSLLIATMHFLRKKFPTTLTEPQQNTMIGPYSFIITLYAFLLGFVVVTLWHTFTDGGDITAKEAESIVVLYRLAEGLPDGQPVQKTLLEYTRSVRVDEWPAMAAGLASTKTEAIYERLWEEGRAISPTTVREQVFHAKFIDELSALSCHRRDRTLLNAREMPGALWGALFIGGFLMLLGLFFLSISSARVQILVDVMVISMTLVMLYLAFELSGPFQGDVRVSPEPFALIEKSLRLPPQ